MKRCLPALLLACCALCSEARSATASSADLLFLKSDSSGALQRAAKELRSNPADLNAWLVRMEAARLQLQTRLELQSAIALLSKTHSADVRAQLAAERVRELAANTPEFRAEIPRIGQLLVTNPTYARQLSDALLRARTEGAPLPRGVHLAKRITMWQIAGSFGRFSNVDFEKSWAPEQDQLRNKNYGQQVREDIRTYSGLLELPEYFWRTGVYYAGSDIALTPGKHALIIESDGTFELFVDGKSVLVHDSRFREQKTITEVKTELAEGAHRIFLKLQPSAFPLRIWIEADHQVNLEQTKLPDLEQQYISSALALSEGDVHPALSFADPNSSVVQSLRADAMARMGDDREAGAIRGAAVAADGSNLLAKFQLAQQEFGKENFEESISELGDVLKKAPAYWPAQELKYQLADHFDWTKERQEALGRRLSLHRTCSTLEDAIKLHSESDPLVVPQFEKQLLACGGIPYPYWEHLAARGHHEQALVGIRIYLQTHAADRRALKLAIREAVLSNDLEAAKQYASALAKLSPNWTWAANLAADPTSILDSPSSSQTPGPFWEAYARDPLPLMNSRNAENRVLLNDRVVLLQASGDAWIYQHTLSQVADKRGIDAAGEVELPRSADILTLRTIKHDGSIVEPETNENKNSVSMPSLASGDAVELAYLQHFPSDMLARSPQVLDFRFGSRDFPTSSATLTIIRNGAPEPRIWHSPYVNQLRKEPQGRMEVEAWQANDIPVSVEEPAAPRNRSEAKILWLQMDRKKPMDTLARFRDELITATRITPRIENLAAEINGDSAEEKIAAVYQRVMTSIEDENQSWLEGNVASADDSLAQGEGDRATTLIALLSALGFDAQLELAAPRGNSLEECEAFRCYTHAAVVVNLPGAKKQIALEPQIVGLAAGALTPEIEGQPALVISAMRAVSSEVVSLPRATDQRSVANANLELDGNGTISGKIHIRFGSFRGAQIREALRSLSQKDRQSYFEEIAGRILPNAREVSGELKHEDNAEQALELDLRVSGSMLAHWNGSDLEIGQLIPALGLSRLYATLPERSQSLLLESPLVESSEFVLHLPPGVEPSHLPSRADVKAAFGDYHTDFRIKGSELHIVRTFRIPAQEIAPNDYRAFSSLAQQIDSAERQMIQLHRNLPQSAAAEKASSSPSLN